MVKNTPSLNRRLSRMVWVCAFALLSACGGGGGGGGGGSGGSGSTAPAPPAKPTTSEASRFLAQATFGPNDADIAAVTSSGYSDWINAQLALPVGSSHLDYMDARLVALKTSNPNASLNATHFYETFYGQAVTAPDQLRQRVKFALSEIFVTSLAAGNIDVRTNASFYDMLGRDAFGNFKTLLQDVTYHPAMGQYLTYLANQKENTSTGRNPDENYAREVMQLFTIGLYELNADGSVKTDLFGKTTPTYSTADIQGLAKVFTGLSWYHPTPTNTTFFGGNRDASSYTRAMIAYPAFHSTSQKTFLGTTIPASTTVNVDGDVATAIDTLFNHPNVGPFISKQLIQRLVTSNPSPAYVGRVAAVFNNNGSGVRGDMSAVIRAILLDTEARTASADQDYGKLREPVIRLTHFLRSFEATSTSGNWAIGSTSSQTSLNQSPFTSPSVFNFFRPGYVPPNTSIGGRNKVAPEMQITDEVSTAAYINFMMSAINTGFNSGDVKSNYTKEVALATDATALTDRMNLLLYGGRMSDGLKSKIVAAVNSVTIPATGTTAQVDAAKLNRVKLATLLSVASPEYIAQR
ncbi:DUF1800 domain-containing protein [Asticcacaulis sp. DXS10W]|uniref:DUF1800 domain-containing protein n=1 Tax=Asticcacaulis currens TaxID=2984210 RepID=A0ABT5I9S6_9CAUL|nr:DUF1800 domain-containing protein [Asticcacaulis currens]MDC7692743.1 DUF1800 domain-containing protein [Asticcacaulis currens]